MKWDELRKVAEAATPGPWQSLGQWLAAETNGCTCYGGSLPEGHEGGCGLDQIGTLTAPDAKHAAAFDPPTVLRLLDLAQRAEAAEAVADSMQHFADVAEGLERKINDHYAPRLAAAEAAVERARALVGQWQRVGGPDTPKAYAEHLRAALDPKEDQPCAHEPVYSREVYECGHQHGWCRYCGETTEPCEADQ